MSIEAVGKHFIHKITKNVYTVLDFIPDITTRLRDSRYRICTYGQEYPHKLIISCDALHAEYDLFEETTVEKQQDQQDKYIGKRFHDLDGRVFMVKERHYPKFGLGACLGSAFFYVCWMEDDGQIFIIKPAHIATLKEVMPKPEEPKEEDYMGRYFISESGSKFKIIGNKNHFNIHYDKNIWTAFYISSRGFVDVQDVDFRCQDEVFIETDSNWVPLKKEFVIDKIGFYKTRSGKVAYVSHNDGSERMQWIVNIYGVPAFKWAYSNGRISFHRESCNDIVGPWEGE